MVYHDEFSSRLSVASIMRLRVNAEEALSNDIKSERGKRKPVHLQGRRLPASSTEKPCTSGDHLSGLCSSDSYSTTGVALRTDLSSSPTEKKYSAVRRTQRLPYVLKGGVFLCAHTCFCVLKMSQHHKTTFIPEGERCVHTSSNQQNSHITSESQCHCTGKGNYDRESIIRLVPPRVPPDDEAALYALTGPNGATKNKGPDSHSCLR